MDETSYPVILAYRLWKSGHVRWEGQLAWFAEPPTILFTTAPVRPRNSLGREHGRFTVERSFDDRRSVGRFGNGRNCARQ